MDDNILSQEEIDALMKNKDTGDDNDVLTEEEIDVLGEIGNIAMGSAATALYTLLDQKVEITTPEVTVKSFAEVKEKYNRPCVLVKVEYIAGLEGANLLIIEEKDAAIIADLMMGGDGSNAEEVELDEIRLSAVGEAMNQMMGSSSTSLSSIIDDIVNISPPETDYLELSDEIDGDNDYFDNDQMIVDTSFQLKIGELVDSSFKQLAPLDFTKELVARLTNTDSGGLTAKDENLDEKEVEDNNDTEEMEGEIAATSEEVVKEQQNQTKSKRGAPQPSQNVNKNADVQRAQFPDFDNTAAAPLPHNMDLIQDVPLQVTVRLGKSRMTIKEILDLGEGSIIELDKLAGEPVDLLVNGKLVAKGEVVVIDENFGFRVKDIISPMERINNI